VAAEQLFRPPDIQAHDRQHQHVVRHHNPDAGGKLNMDKDQVSGKFDQTIGKAKEKLGDAVGNQKLANQGVADQVKGAAKETWGNAKDAARTTHDRHVAETEDSASVNRERFTDKVAEMKKKANDKIDDFKDRERSKHAANS
jgi:uncharacterized protein YjbJ (UPF0337 family)